MSIPLCLQRAHLLLAASSRINSHSTKYHHLKPTHWFLEHDNNLTELKWPLPWGLQLSDLIAIKHVWHVVKREIPFMDVQLTDLNQQLFDVIISILTKISDIISKK